MDKWINEHMKRDLDLFEKDFLMVIRKSVEIVLHRNDPWKLHHPQESQYRQNIDYLGQSSQIL